MHKFGLGLNDAEFLFHIPAGSNRGTGSFMSGRDFAVAESLKLPVRNADQYIAALKLDKVDLIKIDVEGFEKQVLTGAAETIKKYRPILWVEISGSWNEQGCSLAALEKVLFGPYEFRIAERTGLIVNRSKFKKIPQLPQRGVFNIFCLPK